ncbi:hypothetical protein V8D89_000041 [Ganoderma adspersum]
MPQPQIDGEPGISIRFYGSTKIVYLRPIPYERKAIDHESFATLPPGVIKTGVPRLDQKKYTVEGYKEWQDTWYTSESAMTFSAENIPPKSSGIATREKLFLKVTSCIEKSPAGKALMGKLLEEALHYKDHLSSVQGEAVPHHYGVWWGRTERGSCIAVSVMQWGGQPYFTESGDPRDHSEEARKAVLEAYQALHMKAGVEHESTSMAMHSFHVLYNEDLKRVFIVDFEYADFKHKCELRMPLEAYDYMSSPDEFGCRELHRTLRRIGMINWRKKREDDSKILPYTIDHKNEPQRGS